MNLYRGCQHHCIYCDSRSLCYGIEDFDGEVLIKTNAIDLLRDELARKRRKTLRDSLAAVLILQGYLESRKTA